MFSLSLGALYPFPSTWRGTMKKLPNAAADDFWIKSRRLTSFGLFSVLIGFGNEKIK
jgi:hypothetical protein